MPKATHVLYRFYDEAGDLLYIGITNNPAVRFRGHNTSKPWYRNVASSTFEHFDTREAVLAAEALAIEVERPKHNIVHATAWPSKISVKPIQSNEQAKSVFGPDASFFRTPDAITEEVTPTEESEAALRELAREWQSLRCVDCAAPSVFKEFDGLVRCDSCLNMWEWDEWRSLNLRLPTPGSATAC